MPNIHIPLSSRLPLRPPPYEADVGKLVESSAFSGLSPVNLRRALANHPRLAAAFQSMAHVVLFGGAVGERDREISIIRTGALTGSEYEWGMHVSIYAEKCGLSPEQVHELTCCNAWTDLSETLWTPSEIVIVRMVDELHRHSTLSDTTWQQLSAAWPKEQVMELIFSSSFYHMAAFFLNSAAVPLEEGQTRFPDGVLQASAPAG